MRLQHGLMALVCAGLAGAAVADDFAPPAWRGQPLSVYAEWDFLTDPMMPGMPQPEQFRVVGGSGNETLHPQMPIGAVFNLNNLSYNPDLQGWTGGPEMGFIDFSLPNWIDMEPRKDVRVQMSYIDPTGMTEPLVLLIEAFDQQAMPGTSYQGVFDKVVFQDAMHVYEDWHIMPNPDWEIIKVAVPTGVTLTQVVIDTISWVPAPATLAMIALGGVFALRRRR